jgi:hypothetical protein
MSEEMDAALTQLGRIEGDFKDCEEMYFRGGATVEQLRAAWNVREAARRKVAEARRET